MAFGLQEHHTTISGTTTDTTSHARGKYYKDFILNKYKGKVDEVIILPNISSHSHDIHLIKKGKGKEVLNYHITIAAIEEATIKDIEKLIVEKIEAELNDPALNTLRGIAKKSRLQRGKMSIKRK